MQARLAAHEYRVTRARTDASTRACAPPQQIFVACLPEPGNAGGSAGGAGAGAGAGAE